MYDRRGLLVTVVLAATPLTIASRGAAQAAETATLASVGEVKLSTRLREFTLRTPELATKAIGLLPANPTGETRVRVLLPQGYDPKGPTRYPVLYLYHGGGGNQTEWTTPDRKGDAEGITRGLPLIVVMPEGGMAGGYSDWYNGGAFGPPRWKTYHLDQLIPWVDAHFRTIADRTGRATAGLSMGGGGLRYAELRPDLIGATAAFSGDIDILQPGSDWNGMGAPISRLIWGDRKTEEVHWRGANGPDLASNLGNTDVAIFAGDTGKPEGVYILPGSTAVHERLDKLGIAHRFTVYPGMTHSWATWNKALAEWLPQLMGRFHAYNPGNPLFFRWTPVNGASPEAHPVAFTYSTIASRYSLYGWNVEMERPVVEFSALQVNGRRRFTIIGSGRAMVRTPALLHPGSTVRVTVTNRSRPEMNRTLALRTDHQGRLTVPIQLGPANLFQQYSSEANARATGKPGDPAPFEVFNDGSRFFRADVQLIPTQ